MRRFESDLVEFDVHCGGSHGCSQLRVIQSCHSGKSYGFSPDRIGPPGIDPCLRNGHEGGRNALEPPGHKLPVPPHSEQQYPGTVQPASCCEGLR